MDGTGVPWYFTGVEIGIYLLAALMLWDAWRRGRYMFVTLLVAMVYGYLLEYLDITVFGSYYYNAFHLMLPGPVPLGVSLGWGIQLYAAMRTSDLLGFDWKIRPWLDGWLLLIIDLCMDPIAAELQYWVWTPGGPWLGIPMENFFGWIVIGTAFSYAWRFAGRRFHPEAKGLAAQAGILVGVAAASLVILFGAIVVFQRLAVDPTPRIWLQVVLFLATVLLASWMVSRQLPDFERGKPVEPRLLAVPIFMFGYLTAMVFLAVESPSPLLIFNTLAASAVGLWLYSMPYRRSRSSSGTTVRTDAEAPGPTR